LLLVARISKIS